MILIYTHKRLSNLVTNNTVAWGQGQGGKTIFLFAPVLSQAGCELWSAVNDEMLRLPEHSAYPTKGTKHIFKQKAIFFLYLKAQWCSESTEALRLVFVGRLSE